MQTLTQQRGARPANPMMVYPSPNPRARLRLFCFPYAGGGASIYRPWPAGMTADIEVCAIQLPGRESRGQEELYTRLSEITLALADAIEPHLDMPFAFFGHSMGSHLCFELARELRRRGKQGPVHLFAAGRHAPSLPDPDPPIHELPEPEFIEELRRLHGTPEEVLQHAELMALIMPILRADFAVCETYVYAEDAPLDCPITVFGGLEDTATREHLDAWRIQTKASFRLRMFPGDHFFLHSARAAVIHAILEDLLPAMRLLPRQA